MRCDDARAAWVARRYGQALPAELEAHLATCRACAAFVQEQTALDGLLSADTDEAPGPGFDTRFFARLEALKTRPQPSLWARLRWAGFGGALVAALAIAALVVVPRLHDTSTAEDMVIAMNLDLLQEDMGMLQQLEEVEAYELLNRLPPGATLQPPQVPQ